MTSASPGSSRLIATVDALRLARAESHDLFLDMLGGILDEETAAAAEADGVPHEFLDFCRVLDGVSCNPSMELFSFEEAEKHQFYCRPVDDSPLPLFPDKLFCIGMMDETPLFLDRASGGVLGIPDEHREWFDVESFVWLASGVEAFFLERLAAPAYTRLVDDSLVEYDDWHTLLLRAGLAG
jgi:hypothetical protein